MLKESSYCYPAVFIAVWERKPCLLDIPDLVFVMVRKRKPCVLEGLVVEEVVLFFTQFGQPILVVKKTWIWLFILKKGWIYLLKICCNTIFQLLSHFKVYIVLSWVIIKAFLARLQIYTPYIYIYIYIYVYILHYIYILYIICIIILYIYVYIYTKKIIYISYWTYFHIIEKLNKMSFGYYKFLLQIAITQWRENFKIYFKRL